MHDLHLISWNITRRCNLECAHCYLPATTRKEGGGVPAGQELTTAQALLLTDGIARVNPEVMLILSGGEPLLREDIFELAAHASGKGMMVVAGSNGLLIDNAAARRLRKSGVAGISISLDSAAPEIHDAVRSHPGAWEKAVSAITACKDAGLSVQINTVVTRKNRGTISELVRFARSLGASVFSPFFLVCTGRGEELTDLSPRQYEEVLTLIAELQEKKEVMMVRTRCAPTIRRILFERNPGSPLLKMGTGRCLAGLSYCRISPEGDVTPCPYMPLSAGNVRTQDFGDIWNNSGILKSLRTPSLKGKCGACKFRLLCGGCRARANAVHQDYLEQDPWCDYSPNGGEVVTPPTFERDGSSAQISSPRPVWTEEAEARMQKVPAFVRSMVRASIERYAIESNCREITPGLMEEVKQKSGMGGMHGHR